MIKFDCKNCGHKIGVPQIHAGKEGKCPKCKNVVVVPTLREIPAKSTTPVTFTCSMCEEEIKVPENSRGQLIACPHCGCCVEVPSEEIPAEKAEAPVQTRRDDEVADKQLKEPQRPEGEAAVEEDAPAGTRKLPWPIDILLYPTSIPGLVAVGHLAIVSVIFVFRFRFDRRGGPLGFVFVIGFILVGLYVYWYFCECIRDSAIGGLRAPDGPGGSVHVDWGELLWSNLRLVACYFLFFGPPTLYRAYTGGPRTEVNYMVLWSLLTYGNFFYPMGILAVVTFESVEGLNPILIFRSIVSTFLPYCGLVALFYGLGVLFVVGIIGSLSVVRGLTVNSLLSALLPIVFMLVGFIWLLLVTGHLLGRFYWRYQEKLNWNV
jgi:DNA-directed RNA polymerase subunit RPC12/RpoP